jgi:hypothetical protein
MAKQDLVAKTSTALVAGSFAFIFYNTTQLHSRVTFTPPDYLRFLKLILCKVKKLHLICFFVSCFKGQIFPF